MGYARASACSRECARCLCCFDAGLLARVAVHLSLRLHPCLSDSGYSAQLPRKTRDCAECLLGYLWAVACHGSASRATHARQRCQTADEEQGAWMRTFTLGSNN